MIKFTYIANHIYVFDTIEGKNLSIRAYFNAQTKKRDAYYQIYDGNKKLSRVESGSDIGASLLEAINERKE